MDMATCHVSLIIILVSSLYQYTETQSNAAVFSVTPGNIIAKIGFPARLDCQTNKPDTFIRWSRGDGTVINCAESNCHILSNSSLYFNKTTESIGGDYTCLAFGTLFGQINGSITIAVKPVIMPRGFTITRNQNETFALTTSITGIPQPNISWLKDDGNFTSGVTVTSTGLQITNAQYGTAGRYSITATNCAGTKTQTYQVFITFLPVIKMTSNVESNEIVMGTTVTLTCSVLSYPGSIVHWEKQISNNHIKLNNFVVKSNISNTFSITTISTIMFTTSEISGASSYCCVATNTVGTITNCLHFIEHGAPPVPSGFKAIERTSSSITVQWNQSSLDGVTYKLQYRVESSDEQWTVQQLQNGETNYTLSNLKSNTSYIVMLNSLRDMISSSSTITIVRTHIPVPGDILSFAVDSTLIPGIFILTWQAPQESVVDFYNVHIRWYNNYQVMKVDGTKTSLNISNLSENVEYGFSIQAVNVGGSGNMTNYRSGVFCLTKPTFKVKYIPYGTTINISWELSDSVYSSRNVMLVVAEPSEEIFTSELINASYRHHCISNLRSNTRYEIQVNAILGCENVSSELDILTKPPETANNFYSQNCIDLNLTTSDKTGKFNQSFIYTSTSNGHINIKAELGVKAEKTESLSEESDSTTLDIWIIVLVVILLLLALAIMLIIGMYCACNKRYTPDKNLELLPRASSNSQIPLNYHTAHHFARSSTSGTRSVQSRSSQIQQQNHTLQPGTIQ